MKATLILFTALLLAPLLALADFKEDFSDATKFAEKWPINKDIYFWRGDAYRMLQKLPEAIDDYTKAIELSPRNTDLYEARARAYILAGAHNQAIVDSTLASMIASNGEKRAAAIATRALAWKAMSKDQNAASDFLIASDVAEKFRLYYLARAADIYANSTDGKVRNGRRSIDLLLSATADATTIDPVARCIIASGYASLGEFETAIELQKQALTNAAKIDLAKFERFLARFESKQSLDETVINYEFK